MNHWRQTRIFKCHRCHRQYLHDRGYVHELFQCPKRPMARRIETAQPGRSLREMAEAFTIRQERTMGGAGDGERHTETERSFSAH